MNKECEYCGAEFTAQRSTARFCSDQCRVDSHRAKKELDRQLDSSRDNGYAIINTLSRLLDDKERGYDAAVTLAALEAYISMSRPAHSSWWRCRKCQTKVQKALPDNRNDHYDCSCGDDAEW